jgi:hypothetical protein
VSPGASRVLEIQHLASGTKFAAGHVIHHSNESIKMKHMKTAFAFLTVAALAAPAFAADNKAILGGAIGGGAGAAVGSAVGGTEGAIIGGAIGGAAGAAIATSGSKEKPVVTQEVVVEKEVVYRPTRPQRTGEYKEKFRDGPCKVEREQKRDGSYKEERECKGAGPDRYRHARGEFEEKFWDGPCKVEREWKRDSFKEKIACKEERRRDGRDRD